MKRLFELLFHWFFGKSVKKRTFGEELIESTKEALAYEKEIKMNVRHLNNGSCPKCREIMDKYDGLHPELDRWFTNFQKLEPLAHVSCAGRGEADQKDVLKRGASKADWGQSAHNYNMALDIFKLTVNGQADWSTDWFINKLQHAVKMHPDLFWGGDWQNFKDMPHVEIKDWKSKKGKLVE